MKNFFKGWYYKIQSENTSIAFIPSMNVDSLGCAAACLQIVTPSFSDCANFDYSEFFADEKGSLPLVRVGRSEFSENGLKLDIKTDSHRISGELHFGAPAKPKYDIMGPFSLLPFMECRHSVFSMLHSVGGSLEIDGQLLDFDNCVGYIEGDRGRSFPSEYLWTQYISKERSVMLSVAEIPFAGARFTGILGFVFTDGHEYRIATYLGARVKSLRNGKAVIRQGAFTLTAELLSDGALPLAAPINGSMARFIHENISCRAHYMFWKNDEVLLDFETGRAGFEYEYKK